MSAAGSPSSSRPFSAPNARWCRSPATTPARRLPTRDDLRLIQGMVDLAVESALNKVSGVTGHDEDQGGKLRTIEFPRIRGGKHFDTSVEVVRRSHGRHRPEVVTGILIPLLTRPIDGSVCAWLPRRNATSNGAFFMSIEHWLAFVAASSILLAIPGPTILLVSPMRSGTDARSRARRLPVWRLAISLQ